MKVWQRKTDDDKRLEDEPGKGREHLRPVAWGVLLLLGGICAAIHLVLYSRFGFHGDELYFMECGWHVAFGYVDHPPMVPWIAAFGMKLFGVNLFAVRFFPALASGTAVVLTGLMAREFGGGRYAQAIAGLAVLMAPAYLRAGGLLCISIFELVFWVGLAYSIARALNAGGPRWWVAAGMMAGLGLLTKYAIVVWGGGLVLGMLLTPARRQLLSPWPWLGAVLAGGIFLPHLVWEATQGWPSLEFLQNLRAEILDHQSRSVFLILQVVHMHPFQVPIWGIGLFFFFSAAGARFRVFGWAFLFALAFFFVARGKPYYVAPAYTVLFAGGAVQIERILSSKKTPSSSFPHTRKRSAFSFLPQAHSGVLRARYPNVVYRRLLVVAILIAGSINALFALPIIPLETSDWFLGTVLGRIVDPRELTREFHAQYGWERHAEHVNEAYRALPPEEQQVCTVLALKYAQASAINLFGKPYGLPRAVSGHMNFYLWGPVPGRGEVAIACGFPRDMLEPLYGDIREVGRTVLPLARQEYNDAAIYVCRAPKADLADEWHRFKRYYHTDREWRDLPATR